MYIHPRGAGRSSDRQLVLGALLSRARVFPRRHVRGRDGQEWGQGVFHLLQRNGAGQARAQGRVR